MNDLEVANGLRTGDSDAFRALYADVGAKVFTYLLRVLGRREMAEELTQDTFLTAIRKIAFFTPGIEGGLRGWVFRIATHRAIDVLRREKRVFLPTEPDALPEVAEELSDTALFSPESAASNTQVARAVQSAIDELPVAQRMIFLLKEQEGMSLLEISRVCGCSANAVKQSLFRARRALREKLVREGVA